MAKNQDFLIIPDRVGGLMIVFRNKLWDQFLIFCFLNNLFRI